MQAALTPRQARFVNEFVLCGNAAEAARRAGYRPGSAKVTACRMLTKANLQAAIAAKRQAVAEETELRKEHVIAAVLGAIQLAKEQGAPSVMISGWVQIARMCGFYDPKMSSSEGAEQRANGSRDPRYLPTSQLLAQLSEGGPFRNPDGSAMTAGQVDSFYSGLSEDDLLALAEGGARVVIRIERVG